MSRGGDRRGERRLRCRRVANAQQRRRARGEDARVARREAHTHARARASGIGRVEGAGRPRASCARTSCHAFMRATRGRVLRVCGTLPGPRMACELAGSPPSCLLRHGLALAGNPPAPTADCRHYQRNGGDEGRRAWAQPRGRGRRARRVAHSTSVSRRSHLQARTCTFTLLSPRRPGRGHRLRRARGRTRRPSGTRRSGRARGGRRVARRRTARMLYGAHGPHRTRGAIRAVNGREQDSPGCGPAQKTGFVALQTGAAVTSNERDSARTQWCRVWPCIQ